MELRGGNVYMEHVGEMIWEKTGNIWGHDISRGCACHGPLKQRAIETLLNSLKNDATIFQKYSKRWFEGDLQERNISHCPLLLRASKMNKSRLRDPETSTDVILEFFSNDFSNKKTAGLHLWLYPSDPICTLWSSKLACESALSCPAPPPGRTSRLSAARTPISRVAERALMDLGSFVHTITTTKSLKKLTWQTLTNLSYTFTDCGKLMCDEWPIPLQEKHDLWYLWPKCVGQNLRYGLWWCLMVFVEVGSTEFLMNLSLVFTTGWRFQPLWKIESQLGWLFFPICGTIENVPNHQPVIPPRFTNNIHRLSIY